MVTSMTTSHSPAARQTASPAGTDARERILAGAADELARHGFAGARVDRIARRARINKRMIYHYFGDKQGLKRAVLEAHPVASSGHGLPDGPDPLAARLRLWALLEDDPAGVPASVGAEALEVLLERARRGGGLPPDADVAGLAALLAWGRTVLAARAPAGASAKGDVLEPLIRIVADSADAGGRRKPRVRLKSSAGG